METFGRMKNDIQNTSLCVKNDCCVWDPFIPDLPLSPPAKIACRPHPMKRQVFFYWLDDVRRSVYLLSDYVNLILL